MKKLVENAKKKVASWANCEGIEAKNAFAAFGCNEGLFTLMRLIALDKDGDDEIRL